MARQRANTAQTAPASFGQENSEDLSRHPFIEIMARWVVEAEEKRLAQAKATKQRKRKKAA